MNRLEKMYSKEENEFKAWKFLRNCRNPLAIVVLVVPTSKKGQQHIRWYVLPKYGTYWNRKLSKDITKTKCSHLKKRIISTLDENNFILQLVSLAVLEKSIFDIVVYTWRQDTCFVPEVIFFFEITRHLSRRKEKAVWS